MAFSAICAICVICGFFSSAARGGENDPLEIVRADEARRVAVFERAARSVVCIFGDRELSGGGSGVIIDERGYGLTNFHVVESFIDTRRGYGGLSDGRLYPLEVLGIDAGGDIAMFKLSGKDRFEAAELGDSDLLAVGQRVAAMGNPFLVAEDFTPTITFGVISGLHRYQEGEGNLLEYADCIQVSSSINPGNSGGPLFDLNGRVLGINGRASFEDRGRVNVGLGYAVSINQIKRFLPWLRAGQFAEHGTLGATVRAIDGRLLVNAIQTLSAAERAGLELGDELVSVAGRPLHTANDFNNIIAIMPAGWPMRIVYRREGVQHETTARLDRLVLPTNSKFLVDLDRNHTELRAWLARLRERWQVAPGAAGAMWSGKLAGEGQTPRALSLRWAAVSTGSIAPQSQPAADEANDDLAAEWRALVAPLVHEPALDADWECIGGDEVDGRVVAVVQHVLGASRRVRWKFDYERGTLLEVVFVDADGAVQSRWTPGPLAAFEAGRWPSAWWREARDGTRQRFTIEAFTPAAPVRTMQPKPQPVPQPQTRPTTQPAASQPGDGR